MSINERAKADLAVFTWLLWRHLDLPEPTPAQIEMCRWLQHGPRFRVLMAFRGVGKSWITASYVLWRLLRNPQEKVMVLSASSDRAVAFSTFVRRLIEEVPILNHLKSQPGQRDSVLSFDVGPARAAQAPSVRALGINGQMTGGRATVCVLDDVEVVSNSESELQREKLREKTKEIRAVLVPDKDMPEGYETSVTVLGTPQTAETLYALYAERGYDVGVWPALYPTKADLEGYEAIGASVFPEVLRRMTEEGASPGDPTDPQRFDAKDLAERKLEYGAAGFALQFQLNPSLTDAEKYPLRCSDAIVMDLDDELAPPKPLWTNEVKNQLELGCAGFAGDRWYSRMTLDKEIAWAPYASTVMAVDPAGRGADETAYCVASQLNGYIYIRALGWFKEDGASDIVLNKLARIAARYPGRAFQIEANFGDGAWSRLFAHVLQEVAGSGLPLNEPDKFEVKHHIRKERRIIDTLGPVFGRHRIVFDRKALELDFANVQVGDPKANLRRLSYQLTHLADEKDSLAHDDRVDALSMAVAYHVKSLSQDAERNIQAARWEALEAEAKKYQEYATGLQGKSTTMLGKVGF